MREWWHDVGVRCAGVPLGPSFTAAYSSAAVPRECLAWRQADCAGREGGGEGRGREAARTWVGFGVWWSGT